MPRNKKVVRISDESLFISVRAMLEETLHDIEEKKIAPKKAVLVLIDEESLTDIERRTAGMKYNSEAARLLDTAKFLFLLEDWVEM